MNQLCLTLTLSRPRFWLYLAGPYLIGYAFGYANATDFLDLRFWYTFIYFLIPANIFIYGVNDVYDRETDKLNPKKNSKETRITDKNLQIYKMSIFISVLAAIPLFVYLPTASVILLVLFLLVGFFYSSPPLRFKVRPVIDSLSNILYALPAFIAYAQIKEQYPSIVVILIAICWTAAMHLYSAIPDIEYDTRAGMRTTAVMFGENNSLLVCGGLWTIATLISFSYSPFYVLLGVYPLGIALVLLKKTTLEALYWKFPYVTGFIGFALFWYTFLTR